MAHGETQLDFADDPELCNAYQHYRQMACVHETELNETLARGDLLHVNHPLIRARYRVQDLMDQQWLRG
jgi:hypothetical protein